MSIWEAAIVILAVLQCSSQVYSVRLTLMSETIDFSPRRLVIGKSIVDKSTLLYALCDFHERTAQCTVYHKSDVFVDTHAEYSCNVTASSQLGKLHLLGVQLWGADKALFAWRDINNDNGQGELYIEALHMRNCFSKVNQFQIDIRADNKPREHIITSQFNYHVTFPNQRQCFNHMCNVTVDMDGQASDPQPGISSTNLIRALEPIEDSSKNLLINVAEDRDYAVELYLINGETEQFLTSFYYPSLIGWSSSNGIISFCHLRECKRYNLAGELQSQRTLRIEHIPTKYVTLYNMPDGGHLALVCSSEQASVHRILHIREDGTQGYAYDLKNLQCIYKRYLTGKFYEKRSREYCLVLFYAENRQTARFESYCFSL